MESRPEHRWFRLAIPPARECFLRRPRLGDSDDGYDCINTPAAESSSTPAGPTTTAASTANKNVSRSALRRHRRRIPNPPSVNTVIFCLSATRANGFYANHQPGQPQWYNNTAYNDSLPISTCSSHRYTPANSSVPAREVMHNNLAYVGRITISETGTWSP